MSNGAHLPMWQNVTTSHPMWHLPLWQNVTTSHPMFTYIMGYEIANKATVCIVWLEIMSTFVPLVGKYDVTIIVWKMFIYITTFSKSFESRLLQMLSQLIKMVQNKEMGSCWYIIVTFNLISYTIYNMKSYIINRYCLYTMQYMWMFQTW